MRELLSDRRLALVSAPMQDVTKLRIFARQGAPDRIFTKDFRVHPRSRPATP